MEPQTSDQSSQARHVEFLVSVEADDDAWLKKVYLRNIRQFADGVTNGAQSPR